MEALSLELLKSIVRRGIESDELDYKAAQSWTELPKSGRGKIVRHLIALANTKGGYLVIGVGEDRAGKPAVYTGVTDEQSASFDPTPVGSFVNRCVEPPINFTIERPLIDGKRYVIFIVRPFTSLPHVCCNSVDTELTMGVFYIRTPEASSRPAVRAVEIQQLLQRAMRNQREQLARVLRGILSETGAAAPGSGYENRFNDSIARAADFFRHRRHPVREAPIMQLAVIPARWDPELFDLSTLRRAAAAAWRWNPDGGFFSEAGIESAYFTNVSLRFMPDEDSWMWQLFKSGLFHCIIALPPGKSIDGVRLGLWCVGIAQFLGRLYSELGWQEEQPLIRFELSNVENVGFECGDDRPGVCRIGKIEFEFRRSAADLTAGGKAHGEKLFRNICERFNLEDHQISGLLAECGKRGFSL